MLDNYDIDKNGVIFQIKHQKFLYDQTYIQKAYTNAPRSEMSHLRFGYLCGSIGHIPDSILDVGYGSGDFLLTAKKMVREVYGNDISPAYPIEGVPIIENIYGKHFEVISFFDVLEHFEDIYAISELKTDYISISLPWCHYFSDDWFENWKHRKPNEHLWHFNEQSLCKFFDFIGFDTINISNIEDIIRKPEGGWKNILSGTFKKRK